MKPLLNLFKQPDTGGMIIVKRLDSNTIAALKDVALFMAITILLHLTWWQCLGMFRQSVLYHEISSWLAKSVYNAAFIFDRWVLGITVEHGQATNTLKFINGYVTVEEGCSGFKQHYQLLGLFLLFPGSWKRKLWYIPFSWTVMHTVNIIRIVVLSFAVIYLPDKWDFIHMWILRPMFYVVIFGLWLWFKRFEYKGKKRIKIA